ncbi:serine/arginine-rich splicing factor 11-like isoform X3 [Scleropages formosus]|uniref:serine/arginine-rich splicing factor 11-like isoform X3 n=1 Tax=Scleropages formosus TaxID=113540 RepID=UPI0008785DE5|nr:serine/arginine-rich splicing factor 11-like isoform X3 [Scleropages formosus]
MNSSTNVVQVTNVSPSTTSEQMRTLFGFLGRVEELRLFPPDDSPLPVTSRVCFVKFQEAESVGVAQHLTNTVFVDRALIVVPFAEGVIPDESKAMSLLAPANAVAGLLPGGGLLPTPNPLASIGGVPLATLGAPALDPTLAALGLPGSNINSPSLAADQLLKFMTSVDPKLNHVASGMNINPGLKADSSSKEIEEAMKRVREAQSLISAAIEPGNKKDSKRKHSRSRSRSRRRSSRSHSSHRHSKSRSRRRSHSRSRRRSKSPHRRRTHSKERNRRSRSRSRDRKKEEKKRSKTPPKSYSTTRRSRSISRRKRSRSASRSSKKSKSPKRKLSRSPSPRRHKKEKKKDRERERDKDRERKEEKERSRDERERSTSKKRRKSKDKERDREKSDTEKGDVKVTRDYDEEEQGYDSEKGEKRDSPPSLDATELSVPVKEPKINGDDHHEEDMDMSD